MKGKLIPKSLNLVGIKVKSDFLSTINSNLFPYIGLISNKYSTLAELYQAGQTNSLKIGIFQWNQNLRPTEANGIVFIGNWNVCAFCLSSHEMYRMKDANQWERII